MTRGVGSKWKVFFWTLEDSGELNPNNENHIWLIHRLFLPHINRDLTVWAEMHNLHKIQIRGERTRSPTDMFVFDGIKDGIRPLRVAGQPGNDADEDALDVIDEGEADEVDVDVELAAMAGEEERGLPNGQAHNPFVVPDVPRHLSRVNCNPPPCNLTGEQLGRFKTFLASCPFLNAIDMEGRKRLWRAALPFCVALFAE